MITDVAITVDVEFSIGGAFADPSAKRPIGPETVECRVDGEAAGLGFILNTLERYGLRGVCFVEVMNTCYFGDEPMGNIARSIHLRGHDVQLHLHPCWTAFAHPDWTERVRKAHPVDSMADLPDAEIDKLLSEARATFERWGLPAPRAFRAGNLQVNRRIYGALARHGIPIASTLGVGIHRPADPALHLNSGRHWIDGVLEVPVTSYRDLRFGRWQHWKAFTVIGTGAHEAEELLEAVAHTGDGTGRRPDAPDRVCEARGERGPGDAAQYACAGPSGEALSVPGGASPAVPRHDVHRKRGFVEPTGCDHEPITLGVARRGGETIRREQAHR